jgi:energy-coupling factor transporter ATP-binding protein EcfA2
METIRTLGEDLEFSSFGKGGGFVVNAFTDATPQKLTSPYFVDGANRHLVALPYAKNIAHCSKSFDVLYAYKRKGMQDALDKLGLSTNKIIAIVGPPGCGKSTTAWLAALVHAQQGVSVAWLDMRRMDVVLLHDNMIDPPTAFNPSNVDEKVAQSVVIFIDGAVAKNEEILTRILSVAKGTKFVRLVSSLQMSTKFYDDWDFEKVTMLGWTLEEYKDACQDRNFFAKVLPNLLAAMERQRVPGADQDVFSAYTVKERTDLVRRKFGAAGHSARWMFDLGYAAVGEAIKASVDAAGDIDAVFHRALGESSAATKNSLIQRDPTAADEISSNVLVFTSDLVAHTIAARKHHLLDLHRLTALHGNAAMRGHAVEADFLHSARGGRLTGRVRYVLEPGGTPVPAPTLDDEEEGEGYEDAPADPLPFVPVGRLLSAEPDSTFSPTQVNTWKSFYHNVLDVGRAEMFPHQNGLWMIPEVPNQGGFDAAQLCFPADGAPYVRFVELTVQLDHHIKVDFMRTFLDSLNKVRVTDNLQPINNIEILVILPTERAVRHAPPPNWKIRGVPSTGNLMITMHVAGFDLTL